MKKALNIIKWTFLEICIWCTAFAVILIILTFFSSLAVLIPKLFESGKIMTLIYATIFFIGGVVISWYSAGKILFIFEEWKLRHKANLTGMSMIYLSYLTKLSLVKEFEEELKVKWTNPDKFPNKTEENA